MDRTGNNFAKTHSFSFGVSRETMKKIYIDEIFKKAQTEALPGPQYTLNSSFGPKVGERYSMRPKNDPFEQLSGKVHLNSRISN